MGMVPEFSQLMKEFMNREDEGGFEEFIDQVCKYMRSDGGYMHVYYMFLDDGSNE